jgi:hypothetical protein
VSQRATAVAALLAFLSGLLTFLTASPAVAAGAATAGGAGTDASSAAGADAHADAGARNRRPARQEPQRRTRAPGTGRVVVIGVPGLQWSDVNATDTPTLMRMTREGAAGAMSVRTVDTETCAIDGWLTLSAGQRSTLKYGNCALPPTPIRGQESAIVPGFAKMRSDNAGTQFGARVGLLGRAVDQRGCVLAVGPGAAIGAADPSGRVDVYLPTIDSTGPGDWTRCPLTVVDVDDVFRAFVTAGVDANGRQMPVSDKKRAAAARRADQHIAQVMALIPDDTSVLVAGLADTGVPHLHVAIGHGKPYADRYLTATSTRRPGLVTLTDLTPTALDLLGITRPDAAVGQPWQTGERKPGAERTVAGLDDQDVAAQASRRLKQPFYLTWAFLQLAIYALAAVALRRGWAAATGRAWVLDTLSAIALLSASVPVATFLTNIVPWWRSTHPLPAMLGCLVVACGLVVAVARFGPWRRYILGPPTLVTGITMLVLAIDVMTGSHLQQNALTGYDALVAGRFYGFGNIAFAVFATATLLTAAGLAQAPLAAGRPAVATGVVAGIGVTGVVVDGWPGWGSDFGGVIAFVPAVAVAALVIAGKRITLPRLAGFGLGGLAVVTVLAYVDSLRPAAQRTHLGAFWDQLVAGAAGPVVARKLGAMLRSLGTIELTLLAMGALLFLVFVLGRSLPRRVAALRLTYERAPALRAGMAGVVTIAVAGFAVNDSGVAIPALALTVAVPLALAASVRTLQLAGDGEDTPQPEPAGSRSTPTE